VKNGAFVPFVVSLEERNGRDFEDHERTLEEIKSLFFNTLYFWRAFFVFPLVISYHDFLFDFALTS
jgi:hypothetical protein